MILRQWFVCLATAALLSNLAGLRAAEAHAATNAAAQDVKKLQLAPGLKLELFANEPLLENPVCFSIDEHGRFYVVETHRYRNSIFDITANTPWLLDDLSVRTVNDRAAFLQRALGTNFFALTNESELIRVVEDRDGSGQAETSSVFAEGFNEVVSGTAAGILVQGTNVWFTSVPDLWRMTLSQRSNANSSLTQNPKPETRNRLATGLGVHISVSGHDVHGLIRGPDGRLYFSFGDRGVNVTNREGVVLDVADTGGVLRCELDGGNLEIFCVGLRNPQELAFDDLGNLWTVDNDTAGADPCRVLHLIEGGDYGWRMSYQHMKGFGPWVQEELWRGGLDGTLSPAGTVSQGPAGLAFYPGTSLAPQLAGKFVHADFPGGVWAYNVKARGASFEVAEKEKLLWNCWPTDVDFGPDGAVYVLDWVQGWTPPGKGRIYRLVSTNTPAAQAGQVARANQLLREGMRLRPEKELLRLLGHANRQIRLEAQWDMAARGSNSFPALIETATDGGALFARLHALWAFRQIMRPLPNSQGAAELAALLPLLEDRDPEVRGQAALVLGEGRLFNAEKPIASLLNDPSSRVRFLALQAVNLRWQDEFRGGKRRNTSRVYFSAYQRKAGALANAVEKAVGAPPLSVSETVGAAIVGSFPLKIVAEGSSSYAGDAFFFSAASHLLANTWTPQGAFHSWFPGSSNVEARVAAVQTNRRLTNSSVADFLSDPSPRVVLEAARAINDQPVPDAFSRLAELTKDSRFRDGAWGWSSLSNVTPAGPFSAKVRPPRDQLLLRALNAHFRLGREANAEALRDFALDPAFPSHLRAEAVFLLGAWEVLSARVGDLPIKPSKDPNHGSTPTVNPENWPGWFDRVVGLWRPLPPRSNEPARAALNAAAPQLLNDNSVEVSQATLNAVTRLRLTNAAPAVLARLRDTNAPVAFRQKVCEALQTVQPAMLEEAVGFALNDSSLEVRASALPYLDRLNPDSAVATLGRIALDFSAASSLKPAELALAQAAFDALGKVQSSAASFPLKVALTNLLGGKLPRSLELDVVEAATRNRDPGGQVLLQRWELASSSTNVPARWRSTLYGGNVERGRTLFFEKVEAQCARCHRIRNEGGIVGPPLDGIARRQNREQLLESILLPNRTVAAGFENVIVELKGGAAHAGLVKEENDVQLSIDSPDEGPVRIAKSEITSRRRGLSAMPEGLDQFLNPREMRDIIEFLASLK